MDKTALIIIKSININTEVAFFIPLPPGMHAKNLPVLYV